LLALPALLRALLLLALLAVAALLRAGVLLAVAEGFVAQLLLVAGEIVEFVHLPAHLPRHRIGHPVVRARRLEVVEEVLQLLEHALGLGHVAAAHGLLHLVEHAVEIARRDRALGLVLVLLLLVGVLLVALRLLGELAQEVVHRLAQLLGELADLLLGGAALHGLAQALLGGAHLALDRGEVALLDLERHLPQHLRHLDEPLVVARAAQAFGRHPEPEEHAPLRGEALGRDHQRIEGRLHAPAVVGVEDDVAALLHEGAGQRLGEGAGGQRVLDGLAASFLLRLVAGHEGDLHPCPGPGVLGEIHVGARLLPGLGIGGGLEGDLGRGHEAAPAHEPLALLDETFRRDDAVIVSRRVGEDEGAALAVLR
jgi:hypothetical protein